MNYQILIVEDDPAIASTLQFSLEREGWQVSWVDTAEKALSLLKQLKTLDAIVLDVGLPDGDGFHLCQTIRFGEHHRQVPILFLTARNDEIDKIIGLEMGADDYITKPFSPREIVARLKAIWRREAMHLPSSHPDHQSTSNASSLVVNICPDFEKHLPNGHWQYQDAIYQLKWNHQTLLLSKTELAIMLALLATPTHILSREQILAQISDFPEHRLARTIDSHIKSLRQKFAEINPNVEVIITHRGLGYSLSAAI